MEVNRFFVFIQLFVKIGPTSLLVCEFVVTIIAGFAFLKFFFYAKQHGKSCGKLT